MRTWVTQYNSIFQIPQPVGDLLWCNVPPETGHEEETDVDVLLPTIVECLLVIIIGYLAGKLNWVSDAGIKGLSFFCFNIAMLPLIFLNIATLSLGKVNWLFVVAILVSKLIIFFFVVVVLIFIFRPAALDTAALYAIFTTQANDFGIAYPLVNSLFGHKHPLYAHYMYLIAPTSLIVVNPIGFLLIEIARVKKTGGSFWNLSGVFLGIIKNPVVNVTFIGLVANVSLGGTIPDLLYAVLKVLAAGFSASVLFILGYLCSQPGRGSSGSSVGVLGPALLITVKTLVSPLITKTVVGVICSGAEDIKDLSYYGFIYGVVPTAPLVLFFAEHYSLPTDVIATSMGACTFLSGPIIYIMAKMASIDVSLVTEYQNEMRVTIFFLSSASLICCIWVIFTIMVTGKWRSFPYKMMVYLLITLCAMYVGVILWFELDIGRIWSVHLQLALVLTGQLATRMWTAFLAFAILIHYYFKSRHDVMIHNAIVLMGVGVPCIMVVWLLTTEEFASIQNHALPLFLYGKKEAVVTLIFLGLSLLVTTVCLVIYFRLKTTYTDRLSLAPSPSESYKDLSKEWKTTSLNLSTNSSEGLVNVEKPAHDLRFAVLLVLLSTSMILGFVVCFWKFWKDAVSGLFMSLEFLDVVLNFGQGIIIMMVFISDSLEVILLITSKIRSLCFVSKSWSLTPVDIRTTEVASVCNPFVSYHYDNFVREIAISRSSESNKSQFEGSELVSWLIKAGLALDRKAGVTYGRFLLEGCVLNHVEHRYDFYDNDYVYMLNSFR